MRFVSKHKVVSTKGSVFVPTVTGGAISQKSLEPWVNNPSSVVAGLGTGSLVTSSNPFKGLTPSTVHYGGGHLDGLRQINFASRKSGKSDNVKLRA